MHIFSHRSVQKARCQTKEKTGLMHDFADSGGKIEAKEVKKMARSSNWKLTNLKHSTASEAGVTLKQGYNGDLAAKDAGRIGGQMVRKMIQFAEDNMPESRVTPPGRF
jgi:hypothetical protein